MTESGMRQVGVRRSGLMKVGITQSGGSEVSMLDPLEFGGAFIITVAGILVVLLIAALFSLAERGGFSWLITDADDRAEAERQQRRHPEDIDDTGPDDDR
jgi:hypothetical protein